MRMYDLIMKKRDGGELTGEELCWMVDGYVSGEIPDYQMSAMLMAVYFRGMTGQETALFTDAVAHSGDMVDLSPIEGIKVDKHSTGGVGDKTSLIVAPVAAACGLKVAKMSGRGLGHTGGTVDKLESIPGMRMDIGREEFFEIVRKTGLAIIGQSGNLAPGDKKLYALRDVTATVDSIPLIAASIMSKKLAAGSDCIVLDVKTGSGAFMKTTEDSAALAEQMVAIGEHAGRRTAALITDMDRPLGNNIGNSLEIAEAVDTLKGRGPKDLTEVSLNLAANMLYLAGKGTLDECLDEAEAALRSGRALEKFKDMVRAQGGDTGVIEDTGRLAAAPYVYKVTAGESGWLVHMDTQECGTVSVMLGAGRKTKEDTIDPSAGIILRKKTGDQVSRGDVLAELYASEEALFEEAAKRFLAAVKIGPQKPKDRPLILARVDIDGTEYESRIIKANNKGK